jgi:DNA helicase-2/ATP-dependent DNA helicase PcrA
MAAEHGEGAMLVLAGPGSGKTAVITERVRWLAEHKKVPPERILVITFSRAAAVEMKKRFEKLTSHQYSSVNFGTFHAIFFNIIKTESHYDQTNIISESERCRIIRERVHELRINTVKERELIEQVSSAISAVKSGSVRLRDMRVHPLSGEEFGDIYRTYCDYLAGEGKLDFDDMMTKCDALFGQSPETLRAWQEKYSYILIDEFQDINALQYRLVKLLALPENNIFAVGDDDQSIYGFRGARPDFMFEFERDFKGCRRILLGVNYRSYSEIIEPAVNLVKHNKKRFAKRLESNAGKGGTCAYMRFETLEEANLHIANALQKRKDSGRKLSEVAVLFRMRHEVTGLHRLLKKRNIPCRLGEKLPCIFDHLIAEDLVSYLRLARGEHTRAELLRVINRPNRYVTRQSVQAAGSMAHNSEVSLENLARANRGKDYVREKLEHLARHMEFMRRLDVRTAIRFIRKALGYDEWLKTYSSEKGVSYDELLDIAGELEASAEGCRELEDWLAVMEEYRSKLKETDPEDGVALMTFHASKGLEFETVFVIDLVEGSVPSNRAKTEEQIEEERRALYVALTRAKKELYVLSSRERLGRTPDESRFVKEMFEEKEMKKHGR